MTKRDRMWDQMGMWAEDGNSMKQSKRNPRDQKHQQKWRLPSVGLAGDWTWLKGESPSRRVCQWNFQKTKAKRTKTEKTEHPRTVGPPQKYPWRSQNADATRDKKGRNVWSGKDWDSPQVHVKHEATDPGVPENTRQDKCPPNCISACRIHTARRDCPGVTSYADGPKCVCIRT